MKRTMIDVQGLCAGYGKREVLRDISFAVEEGCIMGLLGRNGCGKTTLFRCLNALLPLQGGCVLLDGQNIAQLSQQQIARTAALVPQATAAVFSLPVREMMLLGAGCRIKAWQEPGAEFLQEVELYAAELGVSQLLDKQFNELSGGEQQLVLIGRALMQNTGILLLDEPTSHLDFTNRYLIMDMVKKLSRRKQMCVIVTAHDPNLVIEYCDRVLMLKDGGVLCQGATDEVMTETYLRELYGERIVLAQTAYGRIAIPIERTSHEL